MSAHVLVLIASPHNTRMLGEIVRECVAGPIDTGTIDTGTIDTGTIDTGTIDTGPRLESAVWLSPGEACEFRFDAADPAAARAMRDDLARRFTGAPVDFAVVPAEGRRKRLLVADMDSTIIQQECIDEMAGLFGIGDRVAAITERAMRGEIAFEPALRERVALLAGLAEHDLERVLAERIRLMPGARTLVSTMRRAGAFTALVSGGFTFFTSRIRALVGFDVDHANTLVFAGERLSGGVCEPILGREAKLTALEHYRADLGLPAEATLAVGDGANDLAMLRAAGLGVAYRAKPIVAAEADASITHGDLTALLYLQGYRRDEFVAEE